MMKLRDSYDWVVLGDHPGALLSAGLVARLGLSVLVLSFGPRARLQVSTGGQHLDPEPNFLLGLGRNGAQPGLLGDCLTKMGMLPSELERISSDGVFPQVATPSCRVLLQPGEELFRAELDRELGAEASQKVGLARALDLCESPMLQFWRTLPDRLTLALNTPGKTKPPARTGPLTFETLRRQLQRSGSTGSTGPARRWFGHESLRELSRISGQPAVSTLCEGFWYGVTHTHGAEVSTAEFISLLALTRTGGSFQGGVSAYREFLLRLARRLGAHVPERAECKRLFVEDGRLIGVQVASRASAIGVSGGILGCSIEHAAPHVSLSGRKWLHRLKSAPTPEGWRFTLALSVHAEAIPPGMRNRLIWKEPDAPVLDIEIAHPRDYGMITANQRFIFARTLLPFAPETLSIEYQRLVASRIFRRLTELLPFLEFHVIRVYPDFRQSADREFEEAFPFREVSGIPENLRSIPGQGIGSRSGIEGLFAASGESFPRLGSQGGTVAALEATAWIAHRCGLAGPLA